MRDTEQARKLITWYRGRSPDDLGDRSPVPCTPDDVGDTTDAVVDASMSGRVLISDQSESRGERRPGDDAGGEVAGAADDKAEAPAPAALEVEPTAVQKIEAAVGIDLDGDGIVGPPVASPPPAPPAPE